MGVGDFFSLYFFVVYFLLVLKPSSINSYCIKFVDLLGAIGQGGQRYCVVESFSVDVIPAHQYHGCGGCECVQGQP